jgi:hypothetical protein
MADKAPNACTWNEHRAGWDYPTSPYYYTSKSECNRHYAAAQEKDAYRRMIDTQLADVESSMWATPDMANPKDRVGSLKPNLSLVPPVADVFEAMVMETGARKYGAFNWRKDKVKASVYFAAIERHLKAYLDGQDNDPESGLPHLAHIRANTGILLDAGTLGQLIDDRPPPGKTAEVLKTFTKEKP